ncbi:MAG TPA: septation protein A [Hyphomicrobiaceae bacterium]|nr:septation protein A [Hyphomicrobiaceae bacterium]
MSDTSGQERSSNVAPTDEQPGLLKLLIDLGPLVIFFLTYWRFDLKIATGVLIVTTLASLVASRVLLGKIGVSLWVTAIIVTLFGTMTFLFDDPSFIKMKPTVVNVIFAAALGFGLLTGRPFLKLLLGEAFNLTDAGWRILTQRWIALFLGLAVLNEVVWRTMSEQAWVNFKVFGILPITLVFAAFQLPLIKRHQAGQ